MALNFSFYQIASHEPLLCWHKVELGGTELNSEAGHCVVQHIAVHTAQTPKLACDIYYDK